MASTRRSTCAATDASSSAADSVMVFSPKDGKEFFWLPGQALLASANGKVVAVGASDKPSRWRSSKRGTVTVDDQAPAGALLFMDWGASGAETLPPNARCFALSRSGVFLAGDEVVEVAQPGIRLFSGITGRVLTERCARRTES